MSNKGVTSSVMTYNTLIGGFDWVARPQVALDLFRNMWPCGQHPNPPTYHLLLDGLFKNKHFAKSMALFQELKDKKLDHDIAIFNILIMGLCNNGKLSIVRELFYGHASKGLQPNVPTYNIVVKGLCKEGLIDEVGDLLEKMDENGLHI